MLQHLSAPQIMQVLDIVAPAAGREGVSTMRTHPLPAPLPSLQQQTPPRESTARRRCCKHSSCFWPPLPDKSLADQKEAEERDVLQQLPQQGLAVPGAQRDGLGALLWVHMQHPKGRKDVVMGVTQAFGDDHQVVRPADKREQKSCGQRAMPRSGWQGLQAEQVPGSFRARQLGSSRQVRQQQPDRGGGW